METYDLIIIGGGAGAFAAAIKADELGVKTLMINKGLPLGGTCVNVGCVPSKYLLSVGELAFRAKHHNFSSITIPDVQVDFGKAIEDKQKLVAELQRAKYANVLAGLGSINYLEGEAKFVSTNEIEANGQRFLGKKFVIATGSTATVPPIDGLKEAGYLTHIEALNIKVLPKRLLVIGSGPLGLEFAQMYNNFGCKVDLLVRSDQIFSKTEPELSEALESSLSRDGVTIWKQAQAQKVVKEGGEKVVTVMADGKKMELSVDEILIAAGKTPNTNHLGLQNAGVSVNEGGAILVNDFYQTSVIHIYAVGDVIDKPLRLETTAGKEGSYASENALNGTKKSIDYNTVPYTIFTDPQLAGVGLTEEQEMKQFDRCLCRTISFADVPKAIILGRTEGVIKMVIHPETKIILGVHILAPYASELVSEAMMLVKNKNTIDDVVNSLPMFPTLSESLKIVALSFTKDISKLSCCV